MDQEPTFANDDVIVEAPGDSYSQLRPFLRVHRSTRDIGLEKSSKPMARRRRVVDRTGSGY